MEKIFFLRPPARRYPGKKFSQAFFGHILAPKHEKTSDLDSTRRAASNGATQVPLWCSEVLHIMVSVGSLGANLSTTLGKNR